MASRMKQHQVSFAVALGGSPNKTTGGPAGLSGDFLSANRAAALLSKPEMDQATITLQGVYHLKTKTFFKVDFPLRVIGIGLASDLEVTLDRSVGGQTQSNALPFFVPA